MPVHPPIDVAKAMEVARKSRNKGYVAQILDLIRLAFSTQRLDPREYYFYGLYDDRRFSGAQKARFLGETAFGTLNKKVTDLRWWAVGDDKLVHTTMLKAFGAPVPAVKALYHPHRIYPDAPTLPTADALAAFLRDGMVYPFFGKPVTGVQSGGVCVVERYDPAADALVYHDGTSRPVDAHVAWLDAQEGTTVGDGHLMQEVLRPHPDIERLAGPRMSCVRVVVLVTDEGPVIPRACWKIVGGTEVSDGYLRKGNLLAALDLDTGAVQRVVTGGGPWLEEVRIHPITGARLPGFVLPHWEAVKALALRYACIAPKIRIQGWDIGIREDGPVVVEMNTGSSFLLPQLATQTGLLDDELRAFIAWAEARNETRPRGLARLY